MRITMVKKIKLDGTPCRKCADVEKRLHDSGLARRIDGIIVADERDPDCEGMQLARRYGVEQAPFFIVANDTGDVRIYTVFFRFLREVLQSPIPEEEELAELMNDQPDLDYL